ncbi:MAG: short-chain fatty acid transporter [Bacteroidales bacterium]|nr:short-chain fatty acid transporter [Bacteroidota bacterium]MBL6950762.1 short-chain fatty acid transporter [Bacteroidales bacterium]
MNFIQTFEKGVRNIFPSTFTIAIFLTILTFILAFFLTDTIDVSLSENSIYKEVAADSLSNSDNHFLQLLGFWYKGLWNSSMLAFAVQMMLILVLGYVLASTSVVQKLIDKVLIYCTSTSKAAFLVTLITLFVSFFNWGLGLIFGAIFARKVGEYASKRNITLNYPLIAAAGYSGLMVWHGGISGSAPLKVAEAGHLLSLTGRNIHAIDLGQTIFSPMNLTITVILLVVLPSVMYFIGRKNSGLAKPDIVETRSQEMKFTPLISGAEKIDYSQIAGMGLGITFLLIASYKAMLAGNISVIDPNFLNFLLLGLALLFCGNIATFLNRVKSAMGASAGILIQFPLYFGIMGVMKYSGLVEIFSGFLMNISNVTTFPLFTFFSAGLVNIFVPSGGGQWVVQGPIIVEAAQNLGVPLSKSIMALAYGDQITNMIQPFWALPLLGITGLKAKDIIPYTLFLMLIGIVVFISGLLVF